jgi:DNA polymerase V
MSAKKKMKPIPLFLDSVSAGFPSPAEDKIDKRITPNDLIGGNPIATYFLTVSGDSMKNAGIFENDFLFVDKSLDPIHGDIVVAHMNGETLVKRLYKQNGIVELRPENNDYKPIRINESSEMTIQGVVRSVIKVLRKS